MNTKITRGENMRYIIHFHFCHQAKPGRPRNRIISRKSYRLRPILTAVGFVFSTCVGVAQPAAAKPRCDDLQIIFARGSGEELGGANMTAWKESVEHVLQGSTLSYAFYELGTYKQGDFRYPAVSTDGFGRMLGAYISAGRGFAFGDSVIQGVNELQYYVSAVAIACPNTRFVIGGYSQGAMVVSRTIQRLGSDRILYVATFGDPKLYLPEGKGLVPPACLGQSYSTYRAHVPDCHASEGILGSYQPYHPARFEGKVGVWCNAKDIMCSSGSSLDDHVAYTANGLYAEAARQIKTRVKRAFPTAFSSAATNLWASAAHNVAILFDTTTSMVTFINAQIESTNQFAAKVTENGGKVAVISYRDLDDARDGDPKILCDFACTPDQVRVSLQRKNLPTSGGGDGPESALSAMMFAMNNLAWQDGATKSILLVTDDEYLSPDRDGTTLDQVVQRSLEIDPVNVYTLTPDAFRASYADLVTQTNGASFAFEDEKKWEQISSAALYRPEAILNAPEFSGVVGDEFYFDASGSTASDGGGLRYDWDLDGDGAFEVQDGAAKLTQIYHQPFSGFIQVKVTDATNRFATMSAKITVAASAPKLPEISRAAIMESSENLYEVQFATDAERLLVSIDDSPLGYVDGTAGTFTLSDLSPTATIQLAPYTSGLGRGRGVTLSLEDKAPSLDPEPTLPQPIVPSPQPNLPISEPPVAIIIPKAPNTGVSQTLPTAASH